MAAFKEFSTVDGDPIIVNKDEVATAALRIYDRGKSHETVQTCIVMTSGGLVKVKEPFNDVREWLMGQIT